MTVRVATMDDVPALQELIGLSVRGPSAGYYEQSQIDAAALGFTADERVVLRLAAGVPVPFVRMTRRIVEGSQEEGFRQ